MRRHSALQFLHIRGSCAYINIVQTQQHSFSNLEILFWKTSRGVFPFYLCISTQMLLSLVLGYVVSARLNINDSSFWVTIYTLTSNLYLKHLGCKTCTLEIFPRHSAWVSKIPKFNVSNAELNPSSLFSVILSLGLLLWRDTTMATQNWADGLQFRVSVHYHGRGLGVWQCAGRPHARDST